MATIDVQINNAQIQWRLNKNAIFILASESNGNCVIKFYAAMVPDYNGTNNRQSPIFHSNPDGHDNSR
jgi:hypothetical protein